MASTKSQPGSAGPVSWVAPEWLADHLGDDLLILDCQPNIHEYIQAHIPGALYLNENVFRVHEGGIPTRWIGRRGAKGLLRQLGVDADVPIVVYTGSGVMTGCSSYIGDGLEQPMVAYSLLRCGHPDIRLLDGGLDRWKAEGRETTQVFGRKTPSEFRADVQDDLYVTHEQFLACKDRDDVILLDARPPATYLGQGPWPKPGHIPGAVNLPWKGLMDPQNPRQLRPEAEIRLAVEAVGATPDKTVICSCGTGREATNEYLIFRYLLGYPAVRLYEGSFTEWTADPANPTVTGPNPR